MKQVAKLVLMWLLAVALPVQGLSAATMLACSSGHQEPRGVQSPAHLHAEKPGPHRSPPHDAVAAHSHAAVDDTQADAPGLAQRDVHKCSACASCCLNAVVPDEPVTFDCVELPDLFASLVAHSPSAYVTDGPERPPRAVLA